MAHQSFNISTKIDIVGKGTMKEIGVYTAVFSHGFKLLLSAVEVFIKASQWRDLYNEFII